jgi:hypothetical protein
MQKQMTFDDIPQRVDAYIQQKNEIHKAIVTQPAGRKPNSYEDFDEDAVELAAAVKSAIRESGISRRELVDAINRHYGWPTVAEVEAGATTDKSHLSLHMFNHYLSKPTEYKMPGALLFAVCRVTRSLLPIQVIAGAAGGDVVTREEKDELLLGKAEKAVYELNQITRSIKRGRR